MSIIYEALKKVEKKLHQPIQKKPEAELTKKNSIYSRFSYFLMAILIFSAVVLFFFSLKKGVFISVALNNDSPKKNRILSSSASLEENIISEQKKIPESSSVLPSSHKPQPETEFKLTGVFFSGEGGFALINNQIVKEKDEVDGATVLSISQQSVELSYQGKIIKLKADR